MNNMSVEGLKEYFDKEYTDYYEQNISNKIIDHIQINNSNLYKKLISIYPESKIVTAKITSMSLHTDPKKLRIRSDQFLKAINTDHPTFLISGINLDNRKILLLLTSWPFLNYEAKKDVGNSFWNFYLQDIKTLIKDNSSNIFYKNKEEKSNGTYYCFFICDDDKFSESELNTFLNVCKNTKWNNVDTQEWDDFIFPSIPKKVQETVIKEEFKNYCSLYTSQDVKEFKSFCPCGGNVDVDYMEEHQITYLDLHHFVPKSWFKNVYLKNSKNHFLAITTVHNPINLIPLCSCCHQSIHKCQQTHFKDEKARDLTIDTFNYIINAYKRFNLYDRFQAYLKEINLTIEELYKYYVDYVINQ